MKTLLWLDDVRNPFENDWLNFAPISDYESVHWVKDWWEFTNFIRDNGLPYAVCFDHDLECYFRGREYTGYDCAKYMVNHCLDHNLPLPHWSVHSANPAGAEDIRRLLTNYTKHSNS